MAAFHPKSDGDESAEERRRGECHLSAARVQLADAHWNKAWDEGRAMNLEQAVAYALEKAADGE